MNTAFDKFLADFSGEAPSPDRDVEAAEKEIGKPLPPDYKTFLLHHNGGEGFIGKHYLILWKTEELAQFNHEYEVHKYAPGLILFGSSGGGEGFAFDARQVPYRIVQVPFIGMSLSDAIPVADDFRKLLEKMSQSEGSLL